MHSSLWLMIAIKVPLVLLIALLIWWASRGKPDDPSTSDGDGGQRVRPRPHPRRPFPTPPRRGPHGDPAPAAPPRTRSVRARARSLDH